MEPSGPTTAQHIERPEFHSSLNEKKEKKKIVAGTIDRARFPGPTKVHNSWQAADQICCPKGTFTSTDVSTVLMLRARSQPHPP